MELKDKLFQLGGELKDKAEKLAKDAVDGSKKVAEKVKIKNAISQAESKLNAAYLEIGKKYEELYADSTDEAFAELLAQVREAKASLEVSRADLAAVDSAVVCSGCGKYVQEGQRFCPNCGTKQPEPEAPVEEKPETSPADFVREATNSVADAVIEVADAAEAALLPKDEPKADAPAEDAPAEDAPADDDAE